MCTAITLTSKNKEVVFGRTMDFSYPLAPSFQKVPAGTDFKSIASTRIFRTRYAVMGTAQKVLPYLFADGVNECGLASAMLYFPGFACYDTICSKEHTCIAASELVFFTLSMCQNTKDVISLLKKVKILGVEDEVTHSVAPLHYIFTDRQANCIVIEKTAQGLFFHENPIGVLTNSPDFLWHMTNLRNYVHLSREQTQCVAWNGQWLSPFGQGGGSIGLPGDFTSPGRFVRCAFLKSHLSPLSNGKEAVAAGFGILGNVSIPKGCVLTGRNTFDYTIYTVFYNLSTLKYYYKDSLTLPPPL